jgi:hypothetical protein
MAAPRQYEMKASATVLATTTLVAPDRCSVDKQFSFKSQTLLHNAAKTGVKRSWPGWPKNYISVRILDQPSAPSIL